MSSAKSRLGLLDSIVRSAETFCEGECCGLGRRRKVSALCLLYKPYHRVSNHFVATRNTKASVALGKLVLVIPLFRTAQFSRSFLPAALRLWNLLPLGFFSGDILSFFKSAMNLYLLRA